MTQHDPRLQEAASKITEGVLLALTALAGTGAPAAAPAEAAKPAAKKPEPKPEPEATADTAADVPTANALKEALIAASAKHGKPAAEVALQSVVDGARKVGDVPDKKRAAVIAALEAL